MSGRWWDDPRAAAQVMAGVDDSDVIQGVGTAVLGYHALAKGALAPLCTATLVDAADVVIALDRVDLAPVAKALGAATVPVMGEGAARYGELLAEDLHHQACQAAGQLVSRLVAKGVPAPVAVARTAEVVGVSAADIGVYVSKADKDYMPDLVVADLADRTLMGFAQRMGARENTGVEEVGKSAGFRARFDESKHRRDGDGQFATKPEMAEPDSKAARRKKLSQFRARRQQAVDVVRQQEADAQAKQALKAKSLSELAAAAAPKTVQRVGGKQAVATSQGVKSQARVETVRRAKPLPEVKASTAITANALVDLSRGHGLLVPRSVAEKFLTHGGFSVEQLAADLGNEVQIHQSKSGAVWQQASANGVPVKGDMVFLEFSGRVPAKEAETHPGGAVTLADEGLYQIRNVADIRSGNAAEIGGRMEFENPQGADWADDTGWKTEHWVLDLKNEGDFESLHRMSKSASEQWRTRAGSAQRMVDRDSEGQFAAKGTGVARQQRKMRLRQLRQARQDRADAVRQQMAAPPAAVQAPQTQTRLPGQQVQARTRLPGQAQALPRGQVKSSPARVGSVARPTPLGEMDGTFVTESMFGGMFDEMMPHQLEERMGPAVMQSTYSNVHDVVEFDNALETVRMQGLEADKKNTTGAVFTTEEQARRQAAHLNTREEDLMMSGLAHTDGYLRNYRPVPMGNGKWTHDEYKFRRDRVFVYGEPEAIDLVRQGERVQLELIETPVQDFARAHGVDPETFGDLRVPIRAVRVTMPDDK